ncbi:hypothetical protein D9757_013427 [Collybiopsis confluens]|uniref:SEP domain-containing protein n=1 Tax=Collybiopsis confluens TaxID=2823264 RepID=A0A8H5FQB5_9AGAR|nr:hypothetical protein D9757_013427 [Collybiopsis confluens]
MDPVGRSSGNRYYLYLCCHHPPLIITMDQEHTKFVLSTGFEHFWRGTRQKERMERFFGQGIFNRDDEMWRMHRGNTRPFFARERISDFDIFERYTNRTLSIISSFQSSGNGGSQALDVQDLYSRFALDAASEFLFGKNLDTLSASLPIAGKTRMGPKGSATEDPWGSFTSAFEMAQQVIAARSRMGYFWPMFELLGDKNAANTSVVHRWLDPLVKSALDEKEKMASAGVCSPVAEKNFLQHLAESTDDPIIIRDQLLSLLLASRDTTACLLTYVTYFMAIYPDVAKRLRAEVLERCGPSGDITYEQLRSLRYMRAVLNETLRLFPPVPLNVRESRPGGCTLPPSDPSFGCQEQHDDLRPLHMPGSTVITYLPLLTQRNPALWGKDADAFDPDRWLEGERLSRFVNNPTMFTPFSAGPRICLGQNYAYNEASFFLVRLLQQFDTFTLAPEAQPEGSLPPLEWQGRKGRQAEEKIWPAAALTLFVKPKLLNSQQMSDNNSGGRSLGGDSNEPLPAGWGQSNARRIGRIGGSGGGAGPIRSLQDMGGSGGPPPGGGHSHDDDDDDDDDAEGESWFAGGERSGISVQNPDRPGAGAVPGGNMVRDLLRRAAEAGPPPVAESGSRFFTGGGHKLGSDEVESAYVPDPNAPQSQEEPTTIRHLTFWREGFTVEDGELMRYDDPANETILAEINAGRAPPSLLNVRHGEPVELRVAKRTNESYVPPKRGAFHGAGNRLGAPVPAAASGSSAQAMPGSFHTSSTSAPSARAEPVTKFQVDQSQPMTSVQIRLADGTSSRPENLVRPYSIQTTFPNRTLDNNSATIEEAGLKNSVVVQKWE